MSAADNSAFSPRHNDTRIRELLERNCMLYFPPNRFEEPAWLNEDNLRARARHMVAGGSPGTLDALNTLVADRCGLTRD